MKVNIVNLSHIKDSGRFSPKYHLSEGIKYLRIIFSHKFKTLKDVTSSISNIGVNKRIFVSKKEKGIPFISNTSIGNTNPMESCKYVSKKYHGASERRVEKEMILMAGIGSTSVGDVNFASISLEGSLTPIGNIIRIKSNEDIYSGYLFAYLKSKIGYSIIKRLVSGSGQVYLDPTTVSKIPIPILPKQKQEDIHNLIVEASDLRVEANQLLKEAVAFFDDLNIEYKEGARIEEKVSISRISSGKKRFDASYSIISKKVDSVIEKSNIEYKTIKSQASGIFIGPRAKRNYVSSGVEFLSTSAMQKANPTKVDKYISEKSSKGFIVSEGWILTTRSGTLGETTFALPCIDGYAVSEDAVRIVVKEKSELTNYYIYAFLKSNIGKSSLLCGSYGSVILHLNEDYVGGIKVPVLNDNSVNLINGKIALYIEKVNTSILKENKAITQIEKEIESWQK